MKVFLFCIGVFLHLSCLAQTGLPPIYDIDKDTTNYPIDSAHFQLLADPAGKLTINQVSREPLSSQFYYDAFRNEDRSSSVYWIRIRIRNNLSKEVKLLYSDSGSDYATFFTQENDGRWQQQLGGSLRPYSQRTIHSGIRVQTRFFVTIQPGQTKTIYLRSEVVFWHAKRTFISPSLLTEQYRLQSSFETFQNGGWQGYFLDGVLLGILLLAGVGNILIFVSIRDRTYLYFGICLLFIALDRNDYPVQELLFPEYPYLFQLAGNFFFIVYYVFFIESIRAFLQPTDSQKALSRFINLSLFLFFFLLISQFLMGGLPHFPLDTMNILLEVAVRVVFALVLLMNVRLLRKGVRQARSSLIATLPLFFFWMVSLVNGLFYYFFKADLFALDIDLFYYFEGGCFAWLIIFFSGALVGRYNDVNRQVSQQALEREQLERERIQERTQLIASQNEQLERQVEERTAELQTSLDNLKATQAQLIQSEKMASLGELTAGIAHEIQNPLNFVNNFAEVSAELVSELEDEQQNPSRDPSLETELLTDLKQNLQRISQHGNRASSIVRGMLEHSRTSAGQKEPTDINALCDEYLRLAYHGLRAKDKTFNCELTTQLDPAMKAIPVVAQDIGRVVLNLLNNAFYAVRERQQTAPEMYKPAVTVTTRQLEKTVEISIRDNGTGMPDSIKQKIFQPFFTTKPTGSGTGLGLSLSFDIITKGHGGTLAVDSHEGEGTAFVITLPVA